MRRDRQIFEGPNGTPRPKRDVSPNSRLSATIRERLDAFTRDMIECALFTLGRNLAGIAPLAAIASPHAAVVETMLVRIRRELDQWGEWEHRCYSRFVISDAEWMPQCACGSWPMLDEPDVRIDLQRREHALFVRWWPKSGPSFIAARPGTSITRGMG